MNKEIKKQVKYLREVHYGASVTGDEYEKQLMDLYLQGAKDLWEVIGGTVRGAVGVEAESINYVLKKQDTKAQQFIDSLTKENKDDAK